MYITLKDIEKITRVEVIEDGVGRVYVKNRGAYVEFMVQDDGRTLKLFIKKRKEKMIVDIKDELTVGGLKRFLTK